MTEKRLPKPTSSKQLEANRRNAQKSTGARTAAGKAASSANATRHGGYATSIQPIRRGPFAEDGDEVRAFVDGYVAARRPRDDLERVRAVSMANLEWRIQRVGRLETEEFHRASRATVHRGGVIRDGDEVAGEDLELAQAFHDFVADGCTAPGDADPEKLVDWLHATLHRDPYGRRLEGWRWETPPASREDWWGCVAGTVDLEWDDHDHAEAWAEEQLARAHDEYRRHHEVAAETATERLIESLPKVAGLLSRLQRDLERQTAMYTQLQCRDLPEDDQDPGEEHDADLPEASH